MFSSNKLLASVFLTCCFVVAFAFTSGGLGIFQLNQLRNPASIQQGYDLSAYEGEVLVEVAKARILNGFFVRSVARNEFEFGLGHFVFKSGEGQLRNACDEFNKIRLVWMADGIAVSGDLPTVTVESDCLMRGDLSKVEPILFPFERLTAYQAQDGELQLPGVRSSIKLSGLDGQWPDTLILKSIEFIGAGARLEITTDQIVRRLGRPVVIHR